MQHINARPSTVCNIGTEILGAARHRNDTYDNPEHKARQLQIKQNARDLKALKLAASDEIKQITGKVDLVAFISKYELDKAKLSCELLKSFDGDMKAFRDLVLSCADRGQKEILRKSYNSTLNKISKLRYESESDLMAYFETKTRDSFTEYNGVKSQWYTESKSIDFSPNLVKAVQFGNSVPDSERIYCLENLSGSISLLKQFFDFDFASIGFAYGARGKAGSIAHYENSSKVLQFNRHWDGALIHELGHAIDYSLGLVSNDIPYSIRSKYRQQLRDNKIAKFDYYSDRKEIFARLFEKYCEKMVPELSTFALSIYDSNVMPELDVEAFDYMTNALAKIIKVK